MPVVYLPQSVENVFLLRASERDVDCAPTKYTVDEENKTLFIDEDCLYQVLSDGTFRLVRCNYGGDLVTARSVQMHLRSAVDHSMYGYRIRCGSLAMKRFMPPV